jgi:hypothetical protein
VEVRVGWLEGGMGAVKESIWPGCGWCDSDEADGGLVGEDGCSVSGHRANSMNIVVSVMSVMSGWELVLWSAWAGRRSDACKRNEVVVSSFACGRCLGIAVGGRPSCWVIAVPVVSVVVSRSWW